MPDQLSPGEKRKLKEWRSKHLKDAEFRRRLEHIQTHVENLWGHHTTIPWYTFHGPKHSFKVEELLYKLIPVNEPTLTEKEWFYLIAAAWLHDVGMIKRPDDDDKAVRDQHHERSAVHIQQNRDKLGFDPSVADTVAEIAKFHRRREDLRKFLNRDSSVRGDLLAAYLRLADALHVDSSRGDEATFRLLLEAGMPWESRFHWAKSRWVTGVYPDIDNLAVRIDAYDTPSDSVTHGLLPRLVRDEILQELESVRDVLIRGRISCLTDVDVQPVGPPTREDECNELEMVLSNIRLEHLSSATEVALSVLKTIIRLACSRTPRIQAVRDYVAQVESVLDVRPCHTLMRDVARIAREILDDDSLPAGSRRMAPLKSRLQSVLRKRESVAAAVAKTARPLLMDGGSLLLFGYSSLVLAALRALPKHVKKRTHVYVAECRGKTQYDSSGTLRYSDGQKYAASVAEAEFPFVSIMPDIAVGNLLARKKIAKVVFGANGIDDSGRFGHSAGHLAIAELASTYGVPVYVIADTGKVGALDPHDDLERDVQWLDGDRQTMAALREHKLRLTNPREDIVPPEKVTLLVTELGAFPPSPLPPAVVRQTSRPRRA